MKSFGIIITINYKGSLNVSKPKSVRDANQDALEKIMILNETGDTDLLTKYWLKDRVNSKNSIGLSGAITNRMWSWVDVIHVEKCRLVHTHKKTDEIPDGWSIHDDDIPKPYSFGDIFCYIKLDCDIAWTVNNYKSDAKDNWMIESRINLLDLSDKEEEIDLPSWWIYKDSPYSKYNGIHDCTAKIENTSCGVENRECFGGMRSYDYFHRLSDNEKLNYYCDPIIGVDDYRNSYKVLSGRKQLKFLKLLEENDFIPVCSRKNLQDRKEWVVSFNPHNTSMTRMFWWLVNVRYTVEQHNMVNNILKLVDSGWDFVTAWTAMHYNHVIYDSEHNALTPYIWDTFDDFVNNRSMFSCRSDKLKPVCIMVSALQTLVFVYYESLNNNMYNKPMTIAFDPYEKYNRWSLQSSIHRNKDRYKKFIEKYVDETDLEILSSWSPRDYDIEKLAKGEKWL
jgi:hypothetical protein